ncbi:MAG: hypothetical protein HKO81_05945 [Flavobacteriaceae bacterium]|nr:curli production assembly/transport protein CsgE [Bacteroidia bacterium]NNL16164.1 hypothetical protein [Flavobacteriaceae bacterium]
MKNLLLSIPVIICFQFASSQELNTRIVAELNVETVDKISFFTAKVSNKSDYYFNLKYNFSVLVLNENYASLKESLEEFLKSPNSEKKTLNDFLQEQEQKKYDSKGFKEEFFTLSPFETKDLYKVSVEVDTERKIIVLFLVLDNDNQIISKNRIVLNENENNKRENEVESNNKFQILGLVVEDTKTKSGKDFYDRFFFHYNYSNIKGNQVVKVQEMFSFRRTTRLIISIGDNVIAEFFAYPNEEYIEEMAKQSVQRVYKYFENKKKEKLYISPY